MNHFRDNLRYALFERKSELGFVNSEYCQYLSQVARDTSIGEDRLHGILLGYVHPEGGEKDRLFDFLQIDDESRTRFEIDDLRDMSLESVRRRFISSNISELFSCLPHGEKEKAARAIGVNPSTISRWKKGEVAPPQKMLEKIARYFGLESSSQIIDGYLFYRLEPMTIRAKRERVVERLQALDDVTFDSIYPALERLVRE